MRFEVLKIEFEFPKKIEPFGKTYFRSRYILSLKKYIPKINSKIKGFEPKGKKLIIEFKKPISLNTVNNSISLFLHTYNYIKIDEIEYDVKNKTVEVEINE